MEMTNLPSDETLAKYRRDIVERHKALFPFMFKNWPVEHYIENRFAFTQAFFVVGLESWSGYPSIADIFKVFGMSKKQLGDLSRYAEHEKKRIERENEKVNRTSGKNDTAERIFGNPKMKNILAIEPRLIPILERATKIRNVAGYHRTRTYVLLRNAACKFVGYGCENKELENSESYDLIRSAIDGLLPPDNIDMDKPQRISVTFSPKLRWQVMERDGYKCVKCGRTAADGARLQVDHIYPRALGGMATLDNGQTLCAECNIGKGARIPEADSETLP